MQFPRNHPAQVRNADLPEIDEHRAQRETDDIHAPGFEAFQNRLTAERGEHADREVKGIRKREGTREDENIGSS